MEREKREDGSGAEIVGEGKEDSERGTEEKNRLSGERVSIVGRKRERKCK